MCRFPLLILFFVLHAAPAVSHPGDHGPVDEKHAIEIAEDIARQFIEFDPGLGFGTLHPSWSSLRVSEKRLYKKGNGYYIISLSNTSQGKTLYILMSIEGEVYDANFTGVFPGLK